MLAFQAVIIILVISLTLYYENHAKKLQSELAFCFYIRNSKKINTFVYVTLFLNVKFAYFSFSLFAHFLLLSLAWHLELIDIEKAINSEVSKVSL